MVLYVAKTRNEGRNLLPLKDLEYLSTLLYIIGESNPPIKVKEFIQAIRRNEDKKLSIEYKILNKLCPVFYGRKKDPTLYIISPYEHYHNIKEARPLWTTAFVKLSVDEGMENDYQGLLKRYQKAQPRYRNTTNISFLKEARFKQQRKLNPQIEKYYLQLMSLEAEINSENRKDLGLRLTFRGLLAYLFSEYQHQKDIESKRGKRKSKERHKEIENGWRKNLVKRSSTRIRHVIRNPCIIKEAPFLEDSELFESLGFDVIGLLLQISRELISQLDIDSNNDLYLLRRATERYSCEVNRFFFEGLRGAVKKAHPMNVSISLSTPVRPDEEQDSILKRMANRKRIIAALNEYRKRMAQQRRTWTLNDLKEATNTIQTAVEMEHKLKKNTNDESSVPTYR